MYVLNEKKYIEEILLSGNKPDKISIGYLITLIAKYFFDKNKDLYSLVNIVKQKLLEFNIEGYQEYKYANKIENVCSKLYELDSDNLFRELEYIPIYEKELEIIKSLPNDRQRKFMFTLFAIARYMNCDGWINKKDSKGISEVFKIANVTLSSDGKSELLYNLYNNGYISFGKKVNNLNIKINLGDTNDNIAYKVTKFENLGNQYIYNFREGYKKCSNPDCLNRIKISKTGRTKLYCKKCAKEINKIQTKDRMKTLRKNKCLKN